MSDYLLRGISEIRRIVTFDKELSATDRYYYIQILNEVHDLLSKNEHIWRFPATGGTDDEV
jgi:hypothetical protein